MLFPLIAGSKFMRYWARTAAAALIAVLVTTWPAAADRLDNVKARGKLIVSDTTPPFSFKKPGENTVIGYDLDIVHAVAKRLGATVETVSVSSAERVPMLKDGKLDFVATSMTRTPERLKEIDFSYIYFVTPHAVIVKKSSGISSVKQLAGKKAASASTSTAGGKEGKVDAFPTDESVLRAIVQQSGRPDEYLFLSDFTKSRNVSFALKRDEPRFKDTINKALLDVEESGDAVKIFDTWFGPKSPEPMARKFKIQAD
jgi:polar amino acid transport system substrate-binding protein